MKIQSGSFLERPSPAAISSVERAYRTNFPKEYLRFLETCNGVVPEDLCVDVDGDQRLIVRFLAILDDPASEGGAGWYDVSVTLAQVGTRLAEEKDKDKIGLKLIPFAFLFGGDYLCLDFRYNFAKPSVAYWDHSSRDFHPDTSQVAPSFEEFCRRLGIV
jgi:hypothetical protein